jgi:hypothetical protein
MRLGKEAFKKFKEGNEKKVERVKIEDLYYHLKEEQWKNEKVDLTILKKGSIFEEEQFLDNLANALITIAESLAKEEIRRKIEPKRTELPTI